MGLGGGVLLRGCLFVDDSAGERALFGDRRLDYGRVVGIDLGILHFDVLFYHLGEARSGYQRVF